MLKITSDNHIKLTRGDTARIELAINKDGEPYDFSADTVVFSVKTSTITPEYVFQKEVVDGVIYIAPSDTENLPYAKYRYDVQVTTTGGDVCTVIPPSIFEVTAEVTWSAS